MLKWAITPRATADFLDEQVGNGMRDSVELLTLQSILEQHQLPCLVRFVNDDIYDSIDNYCLLLCRTTDPYLIVSNETERFSIPVSFDGLFAPVERGVTRYNVLPSIRALQNHLKSSSTSNSSEITHFTTLQSFPAYYHSSTRYIRPGTVLEPVSSSSSSSSSSPSSTGNRLRTLIANLPHTLNKHRLLNHQTTRNAKMHCTTNDYLEVRASPSNEHLCLKMDTVSVFVPVQTQLPNHSSPSRSSLSNNRSQGLYTVEVLSQLTDQFPLITELIVSQGFEENVPNTVGYPCRRVTLHRLVKNHPRIIAFDMKHYTFVEIDASNSVDIYAVEQNDTLFQRYQAQLRWCDKHLSSFRSQIKTIVHSSNGIATFVQATPFHGQQLQPYHQRRNSSSIITSPLNKHIPRTIFTSQESISTHRTRTRTLLSSKFHTTTNHSKYEQKNQQGKGKTIGNNGMARKDVRDYFNDPLIQQRLQTKSILKKTSFHQRFFDSRTNSTESESLPGDEDEEDEQDDAYQCTPL